MKKKIGIYCVLALLLIGGVFAFKGGKKYFEISKNLDQMAAVYRNLNTYYVDSLNPTALMESGIEAMTNGLDPYTVFYPEDKVEELEFQKTGAYAGVGASFRMIHDSVYISSLFSDAPFEKAGFKPGDIILALNGAPISGMTPKEIHKTLRGNQGSKLLVKVKHPWSGKISEKKVKRALIQVPSVVYTKLLKNDIGYIRLQQFTNKSAIDFKKAFKDLQKKTNHLSGLIIDLRNNPGGLLQEAVKVSNYFLPVGDTIVSVRGRSPKWNRTYTATEQPIDTLLPLALLINGQTASAAEILSGAMQDLDRGIIIGNQSFGKGLVQGTRKLPYNGQLKLTVGRYYTPSGRCIQAIDYVHRNRLGHPVPMADSLKKNFMTSDGRIVTDKGGITPDENIDARYLSDLATAIIHKDLFFLFAARYIFLHPVAPALGDFKVDDKLFSQFEQFVKSNLSDYQSVAERNLEQFRANAVSGGYFDTVQHTFNQLMKTVQQQAHPSLQHHKKEISRLLSKRIMNCYYRNSGRVAAGLHTDRMVKKAIEILNDKQQYTAILR